MKTVGMIFIFVSSVLAGFLKSMQLDEAVRFWEQFGRFVQFAEDSFRYQGTPVSGVMASYGRTGAAFSLPARCAEHTAAGMDPPEAWARAVAECAGRLPEADRALLLDFGAGLGVTDLEGQLAHCALYQARAQEKRAEARAEKQRKGRLYPMLGAAIGLGLNLLLA